jgi:ABC-2 type transport system permease protein
MTGTRKLLRLALRLDRVRLPIWIIFLAIMPAATAAQYKKLYPTAADLNAVSGVISNPSLVAIGGPLFTGPSGQVTLGALTAWKIGATELILVAVMSILTVIRHSRAEEEAGRLELIGAGVVGRRAPLTAALAIASLANLAITVLVVLFLIGAGMPAGGSLAFGLAVGLSGLAFTAVAGLTAQLTETARSAHGIAFAFVGAAYLLRALGDTGPVALSWISPIGWAMRVRSYADERWWVLALPLALAVIGVGAAYALVARRDLGAGLLRERRGPATGPASLGGPFGLAWRLHRGILLGWLIGLAIGGATMGGAAAGISDAVIDNKQLTDMLARLGGTGGLLNAYLGAVFGIIGLCAAAYTVQATLRMRAEESTGRLESVLATPVGRIRWALSHLVFALGGSALILAVSGAAAGLTYGIQIHDVGGQIPRLAGAALVQTPAVWVLTGLGAALFGLVPRLSALAWAGLIACVVLLELGAILGLNRKIIDASPFAHVPKLPGSDFTATPLLWLLAVGAVLTVGGLAGFRRRDVAG